MSMNTAILQLIRGVTDSKNMFLLKNNSSHLALAILIKHVLLAVAQSRRLPGAFLLVMSHMVSHVMGHMIGHVMSHLLS